MDDIDALFEENQRSEAERKDEAKKARKIEKARRAEGRSFTFLILVGRVLAILAILMLTGNFTFEKPGIMRDTQSFLGSLTYSEVENLVCSVKNRTNVDVSADTNWTMNDEPIQYGGNTLSLNGMMDYVQWGTNTIIATNGEYRFEMVFNMDRATDTSDSRHNEISLLQAIPEEFIGQMDGSYAEIDSKVITFIDGSVQERIEYEQGIDLVVNALEEGVMSIKESPMSFGKDIMAVQIDGDWNSVYSANIEISDYGPAVRVHKFDDMKLSEIYPNENGDIYAFPIRSGGIYIIEIGSSSTGGLDDSLVFEFYTLGLNKQNEFRQFADDMVASFNRVEQVYKELDEEDINFSKIRGNFIRHKEIYILDLEDKDTDACKNIMNKLTENGASKDSYAICLGSNIKGLKSISTFPGIVIECSEISEVDTEAIVKDLRVGQYEKINGIGNTLVTIAKSGFRNDVNGFAFGCELSQEMQANNSYGMCLAAKMAFEGSLNASTISKINDWSKNWSNPDMEEKLGLQLNSSRLDGVLNNSKIAEIDKDGLHKFTESNRFDSDLEILSVSQIGEMDPEIMQKIDNSGAWVYKVADKLNGGETVLAGLTNEYGLVSVLITEIYNVSDNYNKFYVKIYNPMTADTDQYVMVEGQVENGPIIEYNDGTMEYSGMIMYN